MQQLRTLRPASLLVECCVDPDVPVTAYHVGRRASPAASAAAARRLKDQPAVQYMSNEEHHQLSLEGATGTEANAKAATRSHRDRNAIVRQCCSAGAEPGRVVSKPGAMARLALL
jgi:hypothetical protein